MEIKSSPEASGVSIVLTNNASFMCVCVNQGRINSFSIQTPTQNNNRIDENPITKGSDSHHHDNNNNDHG